MALQFNAGNFPIYRREEPDFNKQVTDPLMKGLALLIQQKEQEKENQRQAELMKMQQDIHRFNYGYDHPVGMGGTTQPTLDRQLDEMLSPRQQMGDVSLLLPNKSLSIIDQHRYRWNTPAGMVNPPANRHIPGALERKEAYEREDMALKRQQLQEDRDWRRQYDLDRLALQRQGLGLREGQIATKEERISEKDASMRRGEVQKADQVLTKINQAINNVSGWTSGIGGKLSWVPGTPAKSLAGDLETIKANLGFQQLQNMRANSPTGGALGAVSERELSFLTNTVASLDQETDPDKLVKNLNEIKDSVNRWREAMLASLGNEPKQYQPQNSMGAGRIRVRNIQTGQTGTISESSFNPNKYERL